MKKTFSGKVFRNFIFGVEDSLVSTVGLLSGVAAAGADKKTIILTGVILIFVEAFSMAVGSFLSENGAEEYERQKDLSFKKSLPSGIVMFFSYFVSGFIPLLPYLIFEGPSAIVISIGSSLLALFILGFVSGLMSRVKAVKSAFQMFLIGGIAIAIGATVGLFLS